jgi:NAD(P)-dependent dehydrogenase (short-subunit alcohol dehydrogenase family)
MDLAGRHVVITGGAGGLGAAVVEIVTAAGATCHLPLRSDGEARQRLAMNPRAAFVEGVDLTDEVAVAAFYAGLPRLWASVHLAGGFKAGGLLDTRRAHLLDQLELNLVTAFLCCREAVRNMRGSQSTRGGRLVNVSSRAALVPAGGMVAYTVSKAAVSALTQALADELKEDEILVNAVVPSIIDTAANRAAMPKADPARWPKPAEIARAIAWLLSPDSSLTSGALVPVYGRA